MSGCNRVEYEQKAKEILEEKYGEKFAIKSVNRQYMFADYYTVTAYPVDEPHIVFNASIDVDGENCNDDYYGKVFFNNFSDRVERNLDSFEGVFYVYSTGYVEDIGFEGKNIDIEEYFNTTSNIIDVYLFFISDSGFLQQCDAEIIFSGLGKVDGILHLYKIPDEKVLSTIIEYIENNDQLYKEFDDISRDYHVKNISINAK